MLLDRSCPWRQCLIFLSSLKLGKQASTRLIDNVGDWKQVVTFDSVKRLCEFIFTCFLLRMSWDFESNYRYLTCVAECVIKIGILMKLSLNWLTLWNFSLTRAHEIFWWVNNINHKIMRKRTLNLELRPRGKALNLVANKQKGHSVISVLQNDRATSALHFFLPECNNSHILCN